MTELKLAGHVVVVKEFLTARDNRTINDKVYAGIKMGVAGKEVKLDDLDISRINVQNDEILKAGIVSFDGTEDKDQILDKALDLPESDYQELLQHCLKLAGIDPAKKA